ncbi:hypothetical protein B296_00005101 [Ensete ventricosum]|uniref:Uncharacterized protein n=1 Tax=Ensete ventricosum TaxID=4639 RepID=A0A427A9F6_ENSVE|nr:hypothetical protein B296_00005101 [Ensete ventricosum]
MRLNYVELLYAFLLHFHSEGSEKGATICGQAPSRGGRLRPTPLHGWSHAAKDAYKDSRPRPGHDKGCLQGAAARDQPARGSAHQQG